MRKLNSPVSVQRWLDPVDGIVAQIAQALQARQVHPAHGVVLVPYAQLMPVARAFWMQVYPSGFAPRFETTMNWARSLGSPEPTGTDMAFDAAHDLLTAQDLLERAGLRAHRQVLADSLVESAHTLGRQVAAVPLQDRAEWAAAARAAVVLGMDSPVLALESAVARIALEWALASRYATDVLQQDAQDTACVVVLEGFQPDPLLAPEGALGRLWGERLQRIVLAQAVEGAEDTMLGQITLHPAQGAEDEAQRAAACVLRHIAAGHTPVALVATDRVLTRRVRAMLDGHGVRQRDENGWKLSTTRAAAHVVGLLHACAWNAPSDGVLDWLKNAPAFAAPAVAVLEKSLRKDAATDWGRWAARCVRAQGDPDRAADAGVGVTLQAQPVREALQSSRPLVHWLAALRAALQASGQWPLLEADPAGAALLTTLRLTPEAQAAFTLVLADTGWSTRRIDLAEFTHWTKAALEAASFVPTLVADGAQDAPVVVLPMSQLLARPFAAVVLPGCDEKRLAAAPEPPGTWTAAQRSALGLPTRELLQAATTAAWRHALQLPQVDVLWRQSDEGGEPLLPSPLVQVLQLQGGAVSGDDPREVREVPLQPTSPPTPQGHALPVQRLSASAYEDLRRCPYRFFALRQLGLKESDELEDAVDKRDFGLWLHAVLKSFHEALPVAAEEADMAQRLGLIEQAAADVTRSMGLSDAAFLPFAAAWPQVRDGYLAWLTGHEASGARFGWAERWQELSLGDLTLVGQIDRLDHLGDGSALVMDYKTESLAVSRERVKHPTEDTQLAFYAALQPDDTLQAAYINIGEKGGTETVAQPEVVAVRDVLITGILHDMQRIAAGATLAALGEGMACEYCAARGLCRKDFWSDEAPRPIPEDPTNPALPGDMA